MSETHPLKEWRKRAGRFADRAGDEMRQEDLASQVGVAPSHLSMIEKGRRTPSLDLASQLSKITGIPIDEFVGAREAAQ